MARALVTGAAGFIGSHLVRRLAEEGWEVVALDVRAPAGAPPPGVHPIRADLRDAPRVRAALEGVDVAFHLASVHLSVRADEEDFRAVNVAATADLADAAARAGIRRLVHVSSVGIYGHVRSPPADEATPPHPENAYERTKLAGERAVRRRAADRDLDLVVLRPAWVYGPGCPRTEKLLRTVRKGRFFFIGDGSNLRHPLYVDEMLDACLLAARRDPPPGGPDAYIVAGPRPLTLEEMVGTFARALDVPPPRLSIPVPLGWVAGLLAEVGAGLLGREPPFSRRSLAFFLHDNAFSTDAARRDLGFRPAIELDEGLRRTLASLPGREGAVAA